MAYTKISESYPVLDGRMPDYAWDYPKGRIEWDDQTTGLWMTLSPLGWGKGRSAVYVWLMDQNDFVWPMTMDDFFWLLTQFGPGEWAKEREYCVCNHGRNYRLRPRERLK